MATLPDGDPIIVTTGGNIVALSAANGSVRWQSGAVGATKLVVDATGTVAVNAGETILRFDANGHDPLGGASTRWSLALCARDLAAADRNHHLAQCFPHDRDQAQRSPDVVTRFGFLD